MDTLETEKLRLVNDREKGTNCAACGQFVKLYPRQIHSTIARALILGYKLSKESDGTFHINDILRDRDALRAYGDIQKTRMWGLVEPVLSVVTNGARTSGIWRLTQRGIDFIEGKIEIPKYVYVYDNKAFGFSPKTTHIEKCLNKKFNYHELMK